MTNDFFINWVLVSVLMCTSLIVSGQTSQNEQLEKIDYSKDRELKFDTLKTVILPFIDKNKRYFDSTYRLATLSQTNLTDIDSLLTKCVIDFNNTLDQDHKWFSIELHKKHYRQQLIAVTNQKGQKEVFVNCFSDTSFDKWKTTIYFALDGGNSLFHFKINLDTKTYYDMRVNAM